MRKLAQQLGDLLSSFFHEEKEVAKYAKQTTEEMGADILALLDCASKYAEQLVPKDKENKYWCQLYLMRTGEWRCDFPHGKGTEHLYTPGEKNHLVEPCYYNMIAKRFQNGLSSLLAKHEINGTRNKTNEMKLQHDALVSIINEAHAKLNPKERTDSAAK